MFPLFFHSQIPTSGLLELTGDEAAHAISAVRIAVGEKISLTDGAGVKAEAVVTNLQKKSLQANVISYEQQVKSPILLVVAQALTKGDRARETIELLTQAGVDQVIPWAAARCIGQWKDDALDKWQGWSKEATKQSRRSWMPKIHEVVTTTHLVKKISDFDLTLLFEESATNKLSDVLSDTKAKSILIIIGPEGGVTPEEAEAFRAAEAISVVMGSAVFRSAHAGAAALAAVQTGLKIW